jgi:hypothetical protein
VSRFVKGTQRLSVVVLRSACLRSYDAGCCSGLARTAEGLRRVTNDMNVLIGGEPHEPVDAAGAAGPLSSRRQRLPREADAFEQPRSRRKTELSTRVSPPGVLRDATGS